MEKKTVGDAYQQKKGDLYHYAEVVEICLKAKKDEVVYIENYGDISTSRSSIEVKDLESSITLGSYQIWNTLKNWVADINVFSQYDNLILLTTSPVVTDKEIHKWNKLENEEKLKALIDAANKIKGRTKPSKEKLELFKKVFTFDDSYTKSDLLSLLGKFKVCLKSVNSKSRYEELHELDQLKFFTKPQRKTIINEVIGMIFKNGIEGDRYWEINISELNRNIIRLGAGEKKKLPKLLKEYDKIDTTEFESETFVTELNKIELDSGEIENAIGDYCKTQDTIIDLLDEDTIYGKDIEEYKNGELLNVIKRNKKIEALMCDGTNNIINSRKNYLNCISNLGLYSLELIENEPYFQRGNIHSIVDLGKFYWLIDED